MLKPNDIRVYDLCEINTDETDNVEIYSIDFGEVVFSGTCEEAAKSKYRFKKITSFEVGRYKLFLNILCREE